VLEPAQRFLLVCSAAVVLLAFGCQTTVVTSDPARPTSAAAPDWVKAGSHPGFPASDFIVGSGLAAGDKSDGKARESAKGSALADIASQITVKVSSVFEDRIKEEVDSVLRSGQVTTRGRAKQITERMTKTKVEVKVEAAQSAGYYYDDAKGVHCCLWAADRRKWARLLAARIDKHRREGAKYYGEANRAVGDGEFILAIRQYLRALDERVAVIREESVHSVVYTGSQAAPSESKLAYDAADVVIKIDRLLAGIRMEVVTGDKQRGAFGRPLPKPLAVRLLCKVAEKEGACKNVPVVFSSEGIDPGKVELQSKSAGGAEAARARVTTNSEGYAECKVTRTDYDEQPVHLIAATAALDEILPGVPGLAAPKVTFTYFLRTPSTTKIAVKVFGPSEVPKVLREAGGDFTSPSWFEKHIADAVTKAGFTAVEQGELIRSISNVDALRNAKDEDVAATLDGAADIAVLGRVELKHTGAYKVTDAERKMLGEAAVAAYSGAHIFQLVPSVRVIDVWSRELLYAESWPEKKTCQPRMALFDAHVRRSFVERNAIAEKVVDAVRGLFETKRSGGLVPKRSKKREFKIRGF